MIFFDPKKRNSNDSTRYLLSDIAVQNIATKGPFSSHKSNSYLNKRYKLFVLPALLLSFLKWLLTGLRKWPMQRNLAPLRRIVSRSMEVLEASQMSLFETAFTPTTPFAVIDRLVCGHETTSLLWEFRDLINAYSVSPWVKARHHRCRECAKAIARNERKQPQSVRLVAKAGAVA